MPSAIARERTKPAIALRSRGPRRRSRSISSPARSSRNARPSRAMTLSGRSTSTSPRTAGPIRMPAVISRTTEGMRSDGASPRPSGTAKAIAATITSPVREMSGIMGASYAVCCSDPGSEMAVHLDEDLDRVLLLGEEPDHLVVVVEAIYGVGEQPLEPARVLRLRQGHVQHAALEVGAVGVHRAHRNLVA